MYDLHLLFILHINRDSEFKSKQIALQDNIVYGHQYTSPSCVFLSFKHKNLDCNLPRWPEESVEESHFFEVVRTLWSTLQRFNLNQPHEEKQFPLFKTGSNIRTGATVTLHHHHATTTYCTLLPLRNRAYTHILDALILKPRGHLVRSSL